MESMYYIGLDVHKRKISYYVKDSGGKVYAEGSLPATRTDLHHWMKTLPQPWSAAMEATMFTGWMAQGGPGASAARARVGSGSDRTRGSNELRNQNYEFGTVNDVSDTGDIVPSNRSLPMPFPPSQRLRIHRAQHEVH